MAQHKRLTAAHSLFFCWRAHQSCDRIIRRGLVTFIAAYHYLRIFNSWTEAYEFPSSTDGTIGDPSITGKPFNDAYRYMDWLLTVPLLLIEIVFCLKISDEEMSALATKLGVAAGAMIILGYPGELVLEGGSIRWTYWTLAMIPFMYIVYTLLIGLSDSVAKEDDPKVKSLLSAACWATVISWCTYPVVYIFPMLGLTGADAVIGIQIGCACSSRSAPTPPARCRHLAHSR